MKYENEYKIAKNRLDFIKICSKKHKGVKPESIGRMYYKLKALDRKKEYKPDKIEVNGDTIIKNGNEYPSKIVEKIKQPETLIYDYDVSSESEPHHQKLLMLIDMVKFSEPLSKDNLKKYGFSMAEIMWLKNRLKVV